MVRTKGEPFRQNEHANVAVSWTGGKESALALYETEALGCTVSSLVTFALPKQNQEHSGIQSSPVDGEQPRDENST